MIELEISKNPIAEGNFHWIFAHNCEGTEQLRDSSRTKYYSYKNIDKISFYMV